uniref:Uncharacterized protein n=1 Tax=Chromera velia CCMP2878 TaxID=1169474 RepID=A0A0G4I655_9ALVE|eukprot:Cvel_11312.t1-p1 / transcript=Cvel_11312.t1 / gene=Cvel_11312 / organism=Chromera_velia_CCMP2878 / gene_product=hypothetical protein / transcript_product=hypothetical protein / location=Cvel_scaffold707:35114-36136(+) / protein_length=341 / sequence_SO=supercontig / SO=protein_coding / is_pseudo=false
MFAGVLREQGLFALSNLDVSANGLVGKEAWGDLFRSIPEREGGGGGNVFRLTVKGTSADEGLVSLGETGLVCLAGKMGGRGWVRFEGLKLSADDVRDLATFVRRAEEYAKGGYLDVHNVLSLAFVVLSAVIQTEHSNFLRKICLANRAWFHHKSPYGHNAPIVGECPFFRALSLTRLPKVSELSLRRLNLTDSQARLLRSAVTAGHLPSVSSLNLSGNRSVGRGAWGEFFRSIAESGVGLSALKSLDLSETSAGLEAKSLGMAVKAGKLGLLSSLVLRACSLTDEGVRGLTEVVKEGGFASLTFVSLCNNGKVGRETMREFAVATSGIGGRCLPVNSCTIC